MTLKVALTAVYISQTGVLKFQAHDIYNGSAAPSGLDEPEPYWVLANGAAVPNSGKYAALYAMLSTKFGAAGTLPDLRDGRVPIPKGAGTAIGSSGGSINHVLQLTEYPSHQHEYHDSTNTGGGNHANIDGADPWTNRQAPGAPRTTQGYGGGQAHNNMPPYRVGGYWLVRL